MCRFKIFTYLLIAIFLLNFVNAATIHGTIYDLSLRKLSNARVEINTSPKQFIVAQNGTYSFNAPNGRYTVKAQLLQKNTVIASVQENITISQDGSYVLDLILFPDVEEGIEDINIDIDSNIVETNKKNNITIGTIIFLVLGIMLIGLYYFKKKKQEKGAIEEKGVISEDNGLEQLIKIIKQEGGRTTQKDIRKQIPLSEAKISLMITELEHKGFIEKIKKGRGNIIILKKK